jgi:hypothetical protein
MLSDNKIKAFIEDCAFISTLDNSLESKALQKFLVDKYKIELDYTDTMTIGNLFRITPEQIANAHRIVDEKGCSDSWQYDPKGKMLSFSIQGKGYHIYPDGNTIVEDLNSGDLTDYTTGKPALVYDADAALTAVCTAIKDLETAINAICAQKDYDELAKVVGQFFESVKNTFPDKF